MKRVRAVKMGSTDGSTEGIAIEAVKEYIDRINRGDSTGLGRLADSNLRFIDATGAEHDLRPQGWEAYFSDFPDYRIHVEEILSSPESIAVFGSASGSYKGQGASVPGAAWHVPAAWRAKVRDGKVVEWRVYCDVEPMLLSAGQSRSQRT